MNAWHISYRLSKMTVMPFRANSCVLALSGLSDHAAEPCPFTFWTDKTNSTGVFSFDKPETIRSRLAGNEGSVLDTFGGGEYEWDHFTVKLYNRRGRDTNVTFRYGKNITDLKKTTDSTDVWTGICPFWTGQDEDGTETLVTLPEKVVYSGHEDSYSYRMVIPMDFSSSFEKKPTVAQLRSHALTYVEQNAPDGIPSNIEVSFIQLWQTEEYKNLAALERLSLCDSLTIRYEKLGVSNTARIIKTVYDVLLERYESMTIGDVRTSLGDLIRSTANEITQAAIRKVPTKTALQAALDAATRLIQGGLGGHVVIGTDAEGKPNEILFMDTEDKETAVNVLRINMNGIGFSSTGYEGPFRSAWTLDGRFNADFISTGIYSNIDYIENMYYKENLEKYPIWLADYEGEEDYLCVMRQYTNAGKLDGYGETLDMDWLLKEETEVKKTRTTIVDPAKSWVGKKESDGSHRMIIDIYNSHEPLPRGYAVQYDDAWCATFVSALAVKLGYTDIIPVECSCPYMIMKAQEMGIWKEDDSFVPQPGDIILYDWQDSGNSDNKGVADHVGIVEKVGTKYITVIEGNYSDSVKRRSIEINGRYIRGFIVPRYDAEEEVELTDGTEEKGDFEEGLSKRPKWTGRVTAGSLNVRSWAGTEHPNIKSWPILARGNLVDVCDSLKAADGSLWYYVRIDGRIYGFVSGKYIVRKL